MTLKWWFGYWPTFATLIKELAIGLFYTLDYMIISNFLHILSIIILVQFGISIPNLYLKIQRFEEISGVHTGCLIYSGKGGEVVLGNEVLNYKDEFDVNAWRKKSR